MAAYKCEQGRAGEGLSWGLENLKRQMIDSQMQAARPAMVPLPEPTAPTAPAAPLPPGWRLGAWEVQRAIARSEGSVVYRATDHNLDLTVALQEYLPARFAQRDARQHLHGQHAWQEEMIARGLQAFIEEARLLARCDHPSLVRVTALFEANGTAYRVMPLYDGRRLLDVRREMPAPPDEASLRSLLQELLGALEVFHRSGQPHGGVTPANILLLADDRPLLLGPGAADREIASDLVESLMAGLEPSFNPPPAVLASAAELPDLSADDALRAGPAHMSDSRLAADLYALAEVLRFCITGELPAATTTPTPARQPLAGVIARTFEPARRPRYSADFLDLLDAATSVDAAQRPRSAAQFRDWLDGRQPRAPKPEVPPVDVAPPARAPAAADAVSSSPAAPPPVPPLGVVTPRVVPPVSPPVSLPVSPSVKPSPSPQVHQAAAAFTAPAESMTADPVPWAAAARAARARSRRRLIGGAGLFAALLIGAGTFAAWDWVSGIRLDRFTQAAGRSVPVLPAPTAPAAAPAAPAPEPAPAPAPTTAPVTDAERAPLDSEPTAAGPAPAPAVALAMAPAVTSSTSAEAAPVAPARPAARPVPRAPAKPAAAPAKPRAPVARAATKPTRAPVTAGGPRGVCAPRTEFALYRCMWTQCQSARWASHPQCLRLRTEDKAG